MFGSPQYLNVVILGAGAVMRNFENDIANVIVSVDKQLSHLSTFHNLFLADGHRSEPVKGDLRRGAAGSRVPI